MATTIVDDRSAKRAHPEGSPKNTPEQKLIKLDIAKERNQASSTKSEVPTDEIMADAYVHDNSEGKFSHKLVVMKAALLYSIIILVLTQLL